MGSIKRHGWVALILLWVAAVAPIDLLCVVDLMMGIGIGWDVHNRSNWPQYLLVLSLPVVVIVTSTGLALFSLRLWNLPKWRRASFSIAFSYYAVGAFVVWGIVVKHWIE